MGMSEDIKELSKASLHKESLFLRQGQERSCLGDGHERAQREIHKRRMSLHFCFVMQNDRSFSLDAKLPAAPSSHKSISKAKKNKISKMSTTVMFIFSGGKCKAFNKKWNYDKQTWASLVSI